MKRKLLICSSLITIILSCFSFPIFAEETVQDSSNLHTLSDGVFLDQYFYDNYDLLPYIESDGSQYINTNIYGNNNLIVSMKFSDINSNGDMFGCYASGIRYGLESFISDDYIRYVLFSSSYSYPYKNYSYTLHNVVFNSNDVYFDNILIHSFPDSEFTTTSPIYIFSRSASDGPHTLSSFKLYNFSIFDKLSNNSEGAYVRYYYPAKAKTSGVIGLYDAVSKTFYVSSSNSAFVNPTNEYVENFQISSFLTASLTWISQIFTAIIDMPIVIIFMAIGLAGAMFRWGRRIVHF